MVKIKLPKHIHLYKRINLVPSYKVKRGADPYLVFECQSPTCSHWIPLVRALGKLCECNKCHRPMILDKETVTHARPHCQECIIRRNKPELDKLAELLEEL